MAPILPQVWCQVSRTWRWFVLWTIKLAVCVCCEALQHSHDIISIECICYVSTCFIHVSIVWWHSNRWMKASECASTYVLSWKSCWWTDVCGCVLMITCVTDISPEKGSMYTGQWYFYIFFTILSLSDDHCLLHYVKLLLLCFVSRPSACLCNDHLNLLHIYHDVYALSL